jgi:hypothetical protein
MGGRTGSGWESERRSQLHHTRQSFCGISYFYATQEAGIWRTSNELEGLGDVSSELLGVGHLNLGHDGGDQQVAFVSFGRWGSFRLAKSGGECMKCGTAVL